MALSNIYLLKFNNYYNQKVLGQEFKSILDYADYVVEFLQRVNFNPADGVNTEHTVNTSHNNYDYLIVADDAGNIESRWFVMEASRNVGKAQYQLTLHRDLIVDYYQEVINAKTYIERATLPLSSPFIYNSEGVTTNQIKKKEILLKDETECGWLVGYVSPAGFDDFHVAISTSGNTYPAPSIDYDTLSSYNGKTLMIPTDKWKAKFEGSVYGELITTRWTISVNNEGDSAKSQYTVAEDADRTSIDWYGPNSASPNNQSLATAASKAQSQVMARKTSITSAAKAYVKTLTTNYVEISPSTLESLQDMDGLIFSSGDHLFRVSLSNRQTLTKTANNINTSAGALFTELKAAITENRLSVYNESYSKSGISVDMEYDTVEVSISELQSATTTITQAARILSDAPYRMFAIPVGNPVIKNDDNTIRFNSSTLLAMPLASTIATLMGGTDITYLYDLQYLPYCPCRENITGKRQLQLIGTEGTEYNIVRDSNNNPRQVIFWCNSANIHFEIEEKITVPTEAIEFKIANETEFCRIVSPNYAGVYEFKPTMNRGVDGFEVNATYKPYQPYISVAPIYNYGSLYGGDFNDQRGLICTGDFSIGIVNDAWKDYQITNKSYLDAYNRQVDNLNVSYSLNRAQTELAGRIGVGTAALTGAGGGLAMGLLANPTVGLATAGISGLASAALSSWGLQKDLEFMDAQHSEALSYFKDQYAMGLRNIQALPSSLGKASSLTINNKVFPFVEFYSCTEEEKNALREKIKYNGMNVGVIDTILNYLQEEPTFISGKLIRLESSNFAEDYHLITSIAQEIHKGVYI